MSVMTYQLSYATLNTYQPPVPGGQFHFLLIPCESEDQSVHQLQLENSLQEPMCFLENAFGFTTVFLSTRQSFERLEVDMLCQVRKEEQNPFDLASLLPLRQEHEQLRSIPFQVDNRLYLRPTRLTKMPEEVLGTALPRMSPRERIFDYLVELTAALHYAMAFQAGFTDVSTTARQAWETRTGVCQDYAHIFVGVLRQQGIPARYVSGYLNQGRQFAGNSQMHAWAEARVPGLGWRGFDPSNNLLADHHFIKVAHGTDYQDCGPIRGVLQSSTDQQTVYRVQVVPQ